MSEAPVLPLHMRRDGFDPVPELSALREGEGVRRVTTPLGLEAWLVTRFADVREVLGDSERFSNVLHRAVRVPGMEGYTEEELARLRAGNMLACDPPEHTRLRRMLTPEFTVRRMRALEPRVRRIVADHLDAMERGGPPADLVSAFALPVPSLVICELLGVPHTDRGDFQRRTSRMLDLSLSFQERTQAQRESREYMAGLVARAAADPGDDLLGMLVREHGDDLSADELAGIGSLLLLAGHETTANMLALGTLALLRHPVQMALLRKEPERIEAAVEELLRWLSIVHSGAFKVTTTDVEIAGVRIPEGEAVVCVLPAANRDPGLVPDPDRLDITRGGLGHVAFGHGVHHCLGAPLARMELRIAFPALLERFPGLRETGRAPEFRSFHIVYGLNSLEVAW
ncbi:cytochrome P450 [Thermocatellispora tengchongensis]|uniref:Cytochrome P450 n=1 Tax=Thermocatellispora tengchongensis TaxID=1073253 RepID=A0A840PFK3_9ACTN|nr:cytochrome P450 [Thermocatellispora tengchongensis]MBB5140194.1 cytochrome P450 [Thermocatellispora tengchongensis]